ncbi:phosphoglycerate kinase [Peptoniphilus stercorisuis]|uniref:Phosphoglycerate kinase n=2 Tax=Peptoniphilus stercorisuis TaxID=1436965 RepID=A0ABS4KF25_9FIRM|nr:phosphoglycerate kinase [Peptoniphilus stercorisuis]MBP2025881.1 phosphoglycerate kinase [Peptoniphilus stercorisuis]
MKKTLKDYDFSNKKVLIRVDFNVPIQNGVITNDNRIVESLPTINYVLENGGSVVLMSHLGRPKGQYNKDMSLEIVSKRLSELLNKDVKFLDDESVISNKVQEEIINLKSGEVALLENTRFVAGEEKNDEDFSKELAKNFDIYVNDAFGTSHRAHASNVGVSAYLPSAIGLLIEKEVKYIEGALEDPKRPFVAILGGAKVSDKIGVIDNLLDKVDKIIIVGAMAYTFLKSQGIAVGKSLVENDKLDVARDILKKADEKNVRIILPIDFVVAEEISKDARTAVVPAMNIPTNLEGLDIGPMSVKLINEELKDAKTVIWNGPAGVFEIPIFANGTFEIAKTLSNLDAITIIGGGDSASAIAQAGLSDKMSHISTGGGASLEMLEGKVLPGIACINDK